MKLKGIMLFMTAGLFCLNSCIKDEALNTEADITSCVVDDGILLRNPIITNENVTLYVKDSVDITRQNPKFTVTEGATISPESGTTLNFSTPQKYTVTSQDGNWKKTYTIEYAYSNLETEYHFENMKYYEYTEEEGTNPKQFFHIFYDKSVEGQTLDWGSGNAGFMITNSNVPATDYPTFQDNDGYIGKCVKMITRSTGALGAMFGAPIAAGNLFIGTFEIDMTNMAKSTHFGVPFKHEPTELVGYYKYKAGDKFTDAKGNEITGKKDSFDLYAVLFEVTDDVQYLDGTNSLTSPNIISMARISDKKETDTWTRFALPFIMKDGKSIDRDKLNNGKYNIAIIMSSSTEGATFYGAVGSTLCVDEMQLFYK
jgi:hypothetical protein